MILGFFTKYRGYRARVHTGPGGDTGTSYIMAIAMIFNDHFRGLTLLLIYMDCLGLFNASDLGVQNCKT